MTNTHRLDKNLHSEFLQQGRIDPITGEKIEEGHTIVICSACKSAFFIESWEYLGQNHCNQSETLLEVPKPKNIFLQAKPLEYLPFLFKKGLYFAKTGREGTLQMWTYFGIVLLSVLGIGFFTFLIGFYISELLAVIACISVVLFLFNYLNKQEENKTNLNPKNASYIAIDYKNQALQINRIDERKTLLFNEIEQIEYSISYVYPLCILCLEITIPSLSKKKLNYYASINHSEISNWSNFLEELPCNLKVLQIVKDKNEL